MLSFVFVLRCRSQPPSSMMMHTCMMDEFASVPAFAKTFKPPTPGSLFRPPQSSPALDCMTVLVLELRENKSMCNCFPAVLCSGLRSRSAAFPPRFQRGRQRSGKGMSSSLIGELRNPSHCRILCGLCSACSQRSASPSHENVR